MWGRVKLEIRNEELGCIIRNAELESRTGNFLGWGLHGKPFLLLGDVWNEKLGCIIRNA